MCKLASMRRKKNKEYSFLIIDIYSNRVFIDTFQQCMMSIIDFLHIAFGTFTHICAEKLQQFHRAEFQKNLPTIYLQIDDINISNFI